MTRPLEEGLDLLDDAHRRQEQAQRQPDEEEEG